MVNTSIAVNAWGGPRLLGSVNPGINLQIPASAATELANIQIPANEIGRGIIINCAFDSEDDSWSGYALISAGVSGAETVVGNFSVESTNVFPKNATIMVDTLDSTVANAVTFIGSTGASAGSLSLAYANVEGF